MQKSDYPALRLNTSSQECMIKLILVKVRSSLPTYLDVIAILILHKDVTSWLKVEILVLIKLDVCFNAGIS